MKNKRLTIGLALFLIALIIGVSLYFTFRDMRGVILQDLVRPASLEFVEHESGLLKATLNHKQIAQAKVLQEGLLTQNFITLGGSEFYFSYAGSHDADGKFIFGVPDDEEKAKEILANYKKPFYADYMIQNRSYTILVRETPEGMELGALKNPPALRQQLDQMPGVTIPLPWPSK